MSKQLEAELEDGLHAAAHRASKAGLDLATIVEALEDRAHFGRYLLERSGVKAYPPAVSGLTAMRRAACRA
jgi:hypothetical protein